MEGAFFTESDLVSADRGRLTTAEDDLLAASYPDWNATNNQEYQS